jgi:hypothetical protein
MITVNPNVLLEVAEEIEQDEYYSGASWWFPERQCGCAMVRVLCKTTEFEARDNTFGFRVEGFAGGQFVIGGDVERAVAYVTGVPDKIWDSFRGFTLYADRFQTARALREIAQTGEFTWDPKTREEYNARFELNL